MEAQDPPLDALAIRVLQEHADELLARIVARARGFGGAYADIPPDDLAAAAGGMVQAAVRALAEQRGPDPAELDYAAFVAERRARQGVPLDQVLRAVQISGREALDLMRDLAGPAGLDAASTIGVAVRLWDWIDAIEAEMTGAHRRVELARVRRDQQERVSFVHALVTGTRGPRGIEEAAAGFGLDPSAEHVAVCVTPTAEHPAERLERALLPATWTAGLAATIDAELVVILPASGVPDDLPVPAGVGPAGPLTALPRSHRDASRARATAEALGLRGAHRLSDLALPAAVVAEPELGRLLVARHLGPLRALGPFGEELLLSLRAYLACDQHVDAAARDLDVHPNTLRHRLTRVEETTGARLRRPRDLAEIWWALQADGLS